MNDEARTLEFFDKWAVSFDAMTASFEGAFAPDCVWVQKPLAVTTGPDEAIAFLRRAQRTMGLETIRVETLHLASVGNVVHTERVDHLKRADGGLIVSAPVAGVLEWENGRIVSWREYFDSASFVGRALPNVASDAISRLGDMFRDL
jgi:limonene-1,2-epoxide hydrolase